MNISYTYANLNERSKAIDRYKAEGYTNAEIARLLGVSKSTLYRYLKGDSDEK